jgi:putative ABC transport system permease protein
MLEDRELPLLQEAPIVTMRIDSIAGRSVQDVLNDSTNRGSRGLLRWEYRATFRDYLFDSEEITAGEWIGRQDDPAGIVPISFAAEQAERLNITIGDTVIWNVQGLPVRTIVASLRKIEWQRIQANFMVVFPAGVLESAPQIYVLATRAGTTQVSAALQREIVYAFPNVAMIDLALVLNTLDTFLAKISFVIRFMALFSIFTGLLVLVSAVATSRFQRLMESILLRTLGAHRNQVRKIMAIEYFFLGSFAALTGLILAYASSWALAYFLFDALFVPDTMPVVIAMLVVVLLTILIGLSNSRGILNKPPLEILRAEG